MTTLTRFFYPLPAPRRDVWGILAWWEARRSAFNLILGATGLVTVVAVTLLMALGGGFLPLRGVIAVSVAYGILANLCYTAGPLVELGLDRFLGERALPAGPVLFRQGLIFSVGLTLFPIALAALWSAARLGALLVFG